MKKILYILSGNLSTTPRALQSIKTAMEFYRVDILSINRNQLWNAIDEKLVYENNLNYQTISLQRKPFLPWLISTFYHKICGFIYPLFSKNIKISAYASAKTMYLLEKELKKNKEKYDLIIAHSYSSLYPAYQFAKKNNTPFAFDIEDYHPGENCTSDEKKRREFLMKKILPKAAYLTYASPLIGRYSLELLANNNIPKNELINNCFSQTEFQFKESVGDKIKLVWFSQNIASGRGLELVIPALAPYKNHIELTLIGNLYADFYQEFLSAYIDFIKIEKPFNQKELNLKLSEFDIGLAIELKTSDFNRDICLTNKIFAYAQSGIYILATNTTAQKEFIAAHQQLGILSGQTAQEMETTIAKMIKEIDTLRSEKKSRYEYAKKLAWENESQKLLGMWRKLF